MSTVGIFAVRRLAAAASFRTFLPVFGLQQLRPAGHSKWSKIKHAKGDADAKKSAINTKISKEIGSAVKGALF
jgi:hypothetical protein